MLGVAARDISNVVFPAHFDHLGVTIEADIFRLLEYAKHIKVIPTEYYFKYHFDA